MNRDSKSNLPQQFVFKIMAIPKAKEYVRRV